MTIKFSEVPDDMLVCEEEGLVMTAKEMRDDIVLGQEITREVFIAIPKKWRANAKWMIEHYITNSAADDMYEDWDERALDALMPIAPKIQELIDQALLDKPHVTDYYDYGEKVEIDTIRKVQVE